MASFQRRFDEKMLCFFKYLYEVYPEFGHFASNYDQLHSKFQEEGKNDFFPSE